jgi:Bacterial Ig-like domain/Bacterial Ig domain
MGPALGSRMPTTKRYIPLVLIGLLSACINLPEIDTNPPSSVQPDGGNPAPGDAGTQPGDLTVAITAPTGTFYANSSVSISVDVRGGTPELVQLFKNSEELATLSSPYTYTWNTSTVPEGSYTLTARATRSGRTYSSAATTVIVDHTNLQVSSRSPAPGSTNVAYNTPIRVVFSKPVKATTLSDTTVSFSVAGVLAEKTLSLSSDGTTLTIVPKAKPPLPASFSIGLSNGITDLAGNALVVPNSAWSFELPPWYGFGGSLNAVGGNTLLRDTAMVLDGQDNPVVAWSEELTVGGRAAIFVHRWDGNAFIPVGGSLNATSAGSAYKPALALDGSGNPIVAWQESDGFNENIYVKRWTGSTWQSVGSGALSAVNDTSTNPTPTPARNPSLAARGNEIYVAWDEPDADGVSTIYVWKSVNGGPFVGVGPSGGLVNAVYYFTDGSKPSLVLDSAGRAIVAFQDETLEPYSPTNIYVMRHQQDGYWDYAVPPFSGDAAHEFVYGGLSASNDYTPANDCSLTIDAQDNLYLTWTEQPYVDGPYNVQVYRSTGPQSWERVGSALSAYGALTDAHQARVQATSSGKLFVTWMEFDGNTESGYEHLFSSYWDNQSWKSLTTSEGINQGQKSSLCPVLAIDSSERPVIAWYESRNVGPDFAGDYVYVRRYNN